MTRLNWAPLAFSANRKSKASALGSNTCKEKCI